MVAGYLGSLGLSGTIAFMRMCIVERLGLIACRITVLAVAIVFSSCADMSYRDPTEGPNTARVRFASDSNLAAPLLVFDDASCKSGGREWLRLQARPGLNVTARRLGIPLWDYTDSAAKELVVTTDNDLYGIFWASGVKLPVCIASFSAKFLPGREYEVFFSHNWTANRCSVTVSEIRTRDEPRRYAIATFESTVENPNVSAACLKSREATRLPW